MAEASDIELMEEYDLEATSEGTGSSEAGSDTERRRPFKLDDGRRPRGAEDEAEEDEGEEEAGDEQYAALRATVVDIVSAIGGLEETETPDGFRLVYVVGDDVLREYVARTMQCS